MIAKLRELWRELAEGYSYVRDPHGWERRIRMRQLERMAQRPGMYLLDGNSIVIHPELEAQLPRLLGDRQLLRGVPVYVSGLAMMAAPKGGWPDLPVLERPRLRP